MTRVRFAPSPTGYIHVGNARTALFNWMFARKTGGQFILRVEDTDRERSRDEYEHALLEDLRWLGIDWDEGPDVGGPFGPYRQSARLHIYRRFAQELIDEGKAYHCYCTPEQLQARRDQAMAKGEEPRYDNRCRDLSAEQKKDFEASSIRPSLRFVVPEKEIVIEDLVRGTCRFDGRLIGDFVIQKADGMPTYHFGVVVDDALMKVTHVIRGEGHLSNTPLHVLLYEALGEPLPAFAHMSHTVSGSGKLSKRKGDFSIRAYREAGYLPEALANYLALLGWNPMRRKEVFTIDEVIEDFDPRDLSNASARYDQKKWDFVAAAHMQHKDPGQLVRLARPFFEAAGLRDMDSVDIEKATAVARAGARTLAEVAEQAGTFLLAPAPSEEQRQELAHQEPQRLLCALRDAVSTANILTADTFKDCVRAVGKDLGIKGRGLFHPIRLALTARESGPDLAAIAAVLGKEELAKRLNRCMI